MKHMSRNNNAAPAGLVEALAATAMLSLAVPAFAGDLRDIGQHLLDTSHYMDSCTYEVLLPSLEEPVSYNVVLVSGAASADTLAPCSYIIRWDMATPSGPSHGFSAYFNGDHYRFANNRMQEYHASNGDESFAPSGRVERGVQRRAQFAELLPQFLGEKFLQMASDTTFSTTVRHDVEYNGSSAILVSGVQRLAGFDAVEYEYWLDAGTFMPLRIDLENNPGQLGEQSVSVVYAGVAQPPLTEIGFDALAAAEPEAFERFRTDSHTLELLAGQPLPTVAVPTVDNRRYIHLEGQPMQTPTILVFCSTDIASTPEVIQAVRNAAAAVPGNTEVVWMFTDHRSDDVLAAVGQMMPGETTVVNAGAAARDTGVGAVTPTIIFVDRNGIVTDFIRGYNNDLSEIVIQKATLAAMGAVRNAAAETNNPTKRITMETVKFQGNPCHTSGNIPATGTQAPCFSLVNEALAEVRCTDFPGKRIVLNVFPSLDTPVCAASVRRFNVEASKMENTQIICVSMDLPFAQKRFCTAEGIDKLVVTSAFRSPDFGRDYGLLLTDGPLAGLLARAVIVLDENRKVIFSDLVEEITEEPNYQGAIEALK